MNVKLYLREASGERVCVGNGDPKEFLSSLGVFGIEGEVYDLEGQWFCEPLTGRAGPRPSTRTRPDGDGRRGHPRLGLLPVDGLR